MLFHGVNIWHSLIAAVRSSSAASDPTTEKLECFLDHRSLLGMLQQRSSSLDAALMQSSSRPPVTPPLAAVSDPAVLRSRLGREAFLLNYKVGYCLNALPGCCGVTLLCCDPDWAEKHSSSTIR